MKVDEQDAIEAMKRFAKSRDLRVDMEPLSRHRSPFRRSLVLASLPFGEE
jgi:hypothetical protein